MTPHGLRATNMSIVDAHTLARCLKEHLAAGGAVRDLDAALDRFQKARIPVTTQEVSGARACSARITTNAIVWPTANVVKAELTDGLYSRLEISPI